MDKERFGIVRDGRPTREIMAMLAPAMDQRPGRADESRDRSKDRDGAQRREEQCLFEQCLAVVEKRAAGPAEGLFGPGSMVWRLLREFCVPMFGMRGVLLQIAHPAIASAGALNSNFRKAFLPRAQRTFFTMYTYFFGDLDTALAHARRIHRIHQNVRGVIPAEASASRAGAGYRAPDPALLMWVLATIIESTFFAYDEFLGPLSQPEKIQFYEEMKLIGLLSGIPEAAMPPDLPSFERYFDDMLHNQLEIGGIAKELGSFLFKEGWSIFQLDEIWAAGILPPMLREAFALPWSRTYRWSHAAMRHSLRLMLAMMPDALRYVPAYHQAQLRMALARGQQPTRTSRLVNRLDGWRDLPLSLDPICIGPR